MTVSLCTLGQAAYGCTEKGRQLTPSSLFGYYTMRGSIYEELNLNRLRVLVVEANTLHTRLT